MISIVYDVEADGPCPGTYNMINFGVVCLEDTSKTFYSGLIKPISKDLGHKAREVCGISYEQQRDEGVEPEHAMKDFSTWLYSLDTRFKSWSDNPAFDWQFINYYFNTFLGENPLGFSSRRIGDFYAGLNKNVRKTVQWKKLRDTKHTHNPVDDAMGNAEALNKILKNMS